MPTITVVVLTFNEASRIERCLRSAAQVSDDLLVADSESTDGTADLALALGARVISRPWPGHRAQMHWAIDHAQGEWVMQLDADEVVSGALAAAIREAVETAPATIAGLAVDREEIFLGRLIRAGFHRRTLRVARRAEVAVGPPEAHPPLLVDGTTWRLRPPLRHVVDQPLDELLPKLTRRGLTAAEDYRAAGRRGTVWELLARPALTWVRLWLLKGGWRDGVPGLIFCGMRCWAVFCRQARLWELTR